MMITIKGRKPCQILKKTWKKWSQICLSSSEIIELNERRYWFQPLPSLRTLSLRGSMKMGHCWKIMSLDVRINKRKVAEKWGYALRIRMRLLETADRHSSQAWSLCCWQKGVSDDNPIQIKVFEALNVDHLALLSIRQRSAKQLQKPWFLRPCC